MAKQSDQKQPSRAVTAATYFGKVCKHHVDYNGERYVSNGSCLGCTRRLAREHQGNRISYRRLTAEGAMLLKAVLNGRGIESAKIYLDKLERMGV